ncbi:hypothetical protein FB567DRAFT_537851 [Paraphoma chrysanthemicola]|uniref:Uncharacterized protein n=1 Tax=Paraphoma chrysanthemicola TaxID=798071 RepID=A0A8K0QWP6_9PLEO|nr:hypothetical protein FB567DRAFT_537851 [Paraphoma chrysanthemicola]
MLEAFEWGFPASYGIFLEHYSHNDFVGSNRTAVVGACAMLSIVPVPLEQDHVRRHKLQGNMYVGIHSCTPFSISSQDSGICNTRRPHTSLLGSLS